ncbi:MAG: methyltransferase domain-containing protein [Acidobacteriota bacterium]
MTTNAPGGAVPHAAIPDPANFEFAALSEARNYRRALIREFQPELRGRVVEIGAGIGQFSVDLADTAGVASVTSVEPDPVFCGQFRAARPLHDIVQGEARDLLNAGVWHTAVCVNVLEHIEDDAQELRVIRQLLEPGTGHLCLFVPARPELYAPIDKDFGHFRRYRRAELRQKLSAAGFSIVRLHYFNWAGYFAWLLTFRILKDRHFDAARVRFFDRVVFPFVHSTERHLFRPPFGQSLLAVARANGSTAGQQR